jgi:citrate synthase
MAKRVYRHGDPRVEEIRETVRYDISDEPAEIGTISVEQLRMLIKLHDKNFSDLTENEKLEYEKLFSDNNNDTEEED